MHHRRNEKNVVAYRVVLRRFPVGDLRRNSRDRRTLYRYGLFGRCTNIIKRAVKRNTVQLSNLLNGTNTRFYTRAVFVLYIERILTANGVVICRAVAWRATGYLLTFASQASEFTRFYTSAVWTERPVGFRERNNRREISPLRPHVRGMSRGAARKRSTTYLINIRDVSAKK